MLVLLGESGSGKSSVERELVNKYGYKKIILHTTRPIRPGEEQGKEYHFCTESEFEGRRNLGRYLYISQYNGWLYGVCIPKLTDEALNNSVLVATPACLRQLKAREIKNLCSFYLSVSRKDRLIKNLIRGDDIEEAYRRNLTELGQFDGVDQECDYTLYNKLDGNNANYVYSVGELAKKINDLYNNFIV